MNAEATADIDQRLRELETELDRATELFRLARGRAKQAKEEARLAKKDRKRARKALTAAQEISERPAEKSSEADERSQTVASDRSIGRRIADSPEIKRAPRSRKKAKVAAVKSRNRARPARVTPLKEKSEELVEPRAMETTESGEKERDD